MTLLRCDGHTKVAHIYIGRLTAFGIHICSCNHCHQPLKPSPRNFSSYSMKRSLLFVLGTPGIRHNLSTVFSVCSAVPVVHWRHSSTLQNWNFPSWTNTSHFYLLLVLLSPFCCALLLWDVVLFRFVFMISCLGGSGTVCSFMLAILLACYKQEWPRYTFSCG